MALIANPIPCNQHDGDAFHFHRLPETNNRFTQNTSDDHHKDNGIDK